MPAHGAPPGGTLTLDAPGKINLTLRVLGKRADGYHDLRSILLPVSLCDTVAVSTRADPLVSCRVIGDGVDVAELQTLPLKKQLAVKALRVMQRLCGVGAGADITVVKRIPVGAGMGGGSADAAGVMRALSCLWRAPGAPPVSAEALLGAASEVGSDVAALIHGGPVLMEGRGDLVRPLPFIIPPLHLVIVFPGFPISTKIVYDAFSQPETPPPPDCFAAMLSERAAACPAPSASAAGCVETLSTRDAACSAPDASYPRYAETLSIRNAVCSALDASYPRYTETLSMRDIARMMHNDLEPTALRLFPDLLRVRSMLLDAGSLSVMLSGSGSALFGLAEDEAHARLILSRLSLGMWIRTAHAP